MPPSFVELIDEFLATEKELGGRLTWSDTANYGEKRAVAPVLIGGEGRREHRLVIDCYPDSAPTRFHISLNAPKAIWRLDYDEEAVHANSFNRPHDLVEAEIVGPHYHGWSDNKRFCTHATLPDTLPNARALPDNVRGFENALRWFLGQTGIAQPAHQLIQAPARTRLL